MVRTLLFALVFLSTTVLIFPQGRKTRTPSPSYLEVPFDPASERLPVRFLGHDVIALYDAAKRLQGAEKAEYETVDQFKKRIEAAESKFFMGSPSENTLAFVAPAVSKYDADSGVLRMGVKCSDPGGTQKTVSASIVIWHVDEARDFVATNVYGARVPAHKAHIEGYQITVDNPGAWPLETIGESNTSAAKDLIVTSVQASPDEARRTKATLSALVICTMRRGKQLIFEDSILREATFDHPEEYSENMHFLNTSLRAVWFFDQSGKVYARVSAK
jgi:hypothetical protein